MRHGLFVPAFDELASPSRLVDVARAAEGVGWDGIFLWDHLEYPAPVRNILDPFVCLSAIAVSTSTILLGPMVTPLTRRRLAVVAKQATTLDLLSSGRLVLGLGLGDDADFGERSSLNTFPDSKARGRGLTEGLIVLDRLMSSAPAEHDGEFYRVPEMSFRPASREEGRVPFWLAARWPHRTPLVRAANYEGVVIIQLTEPEDVLTLRQQMAEYGADLSTFEIVLDPTGSPESDSSVWSDAGVTWLLHREGPFDMRYGEVLDRVHAGPQR
jgi:alkanesulfonate monooxygenase SsuD/methylene tetrahydromethanopterin reductase-like flavin-dependent oxidoreductase (luciferase family)